MALFTGEDVVGTCDDDIVAINGSTPALGMMRSAGIVTLDDTAIMQVFGQSAVETHPQATETHGESANVRCA